ncbi:MAG: hypothetical protein HZA19_04470 [Nitrospirae bacterium]|nr:hypothetical protein [Nitrospirota bacterium]
MTYDYQVKAVNSDGVESAASEKVTAKDALGPKITSVAVPVISTPGDGAVRDYDLIISFNEPLNETTVETLANNYSLGKNTGAAANEIAPAVKSIGQYDPGNNTVVVTVTLTNPTGVESTTGLPHSYTGNWTIKAASVKDVAGNTIQDSADEWNNNTGLTQ